MQQNDLISPGTVWLVGAGPGDPDLLTRKAERLLAAADIVFHDALVGPAILSLVREDCEVVSVGKRSGRHSKDQETINGLIVAAAKSGKRVVRLKGGDPSIFARSTEEVEHCRAFDIAVEVCPGITAASAAAASGLVSLTLRGTAPKLIFLTAHTCGQQQEQHDWAALTKGGATLAIYMGRAAAPDLAQQMIGAGCDPMTPIMIVVNASLPNERVMSGRLSAMGFLVQAIGENDPTLLLVGASVDRVRLRERQFELPRAEFRLANRR